MFHIQIYYTTYFLNKILFTKLVKLFFNTQLIHARENTASFKIGIIFP